MQVDSPGRIWTAGFSLLLQAITGLLAASLPLLAWRYSIVAEASFLDLALSAIIVWGILWRRRVRGPALWPALPSIIPVVLLYSYLDVHGMLWIYLFVASIMSRAYFGVSALLMISSYWEGVSLGSDTTLTQLAILAVLVVMSGAVLVYLVESRVPGSPIKTFGDAVWWALATATTVGYGDVVPVTPAGRIIASLLMVFGIGSLGVFISDMAARIVKLALLGVEGGSILDREKAKIIRSLARLEELSDSELELIISKLRLIHAVTRGSIGTDLVSILEEGEAEAVA
jgi:voltage-gated potassium channel Kch